MGTSLTTTNFGLRYPSGAVGEAPDIPDDIRKLASDVDAALQQRGTWTPTFTSSAGTFAIGANASIDCKWATSGIRFQLGIHILFGSSPSFGTGTVEIISTPVAMHASSFAVGNYIPAAGSAIPFTAYARTANALSLRLLSASTSPPSDDGRFSLITPAQSDRLDLIVSGFLA